MSLGRLIYTLSIAGSLAVALGCTTSESMHDSSFTNSEARPVMRHSLREIINLDSAKMARLVDREMNLKEADEDRFLKDATTVLAQTVLIQPHSVERDVALRELKSKLDQEDYIYILQKAADDLIYLAKNTQAASDQATAVVALKDLIIEARLLRRPELNPTLKKIADAHIEVSAAAKKYAFEPMEELVSPSAEAQVALGIPRSN